MRVSMSPSRSARKSRIASRRARFEVKSRDTPTCWVRRAWRKSSALPPQPGGRSRLVAVFWPACGLDFTSKRARLEAILDFLAERDGDIDTRIALLARDLSSSWRHLILARFCLSHGREVEALRWAENGLWLFKTDPPDERLVAFALDLHLRNGRTAEAEGLLWRAFDRRPSSTCTSRCGGWAAKRRATAPSPICEPVWPSPG